MCVGGEAWFCEHLFHVYVHICVLVLDWEVGRVTAGCGPCPSLQRGTDRTCSLMLLRPLDLLVSSIWTLLGFFFFLFLSLFIYFERDRESVSRKEAEGEEESQAGSVLPAQSRHRAQTHEIVRS